MFSASEGIMMHVSTGTALITGASSGLGALYADRLSRRGYDLILVARTEDRLHALASKIGRESGRGVQVLVADLGSRVDVKKVESVLRTNGRITMLVNNAGIGATAPLLRADVERMSEMIALNVDALMRLTYAAVPAFVARGGGAVINIASAVAITPEVLNGAYGGTKAFVLAFSQSLHHELAHKNIRIQAVLPGAVATEFWDAAGSPVTSLPADIVMKPADLVDAALAGFDLGEFITIPALEDVAYWEAYEHARQNLMPRISRSQPATRYRSLARTA